LTSVDWIIVGFTLLLAFAGARQGFVVGALSLAGFAVGAFLGTRLAPVLLPEGSRSPYAPLLGLMGALFAGSLLATGLGEVGQRLRAGIRVPGFGALDGLLGAVLSAAVALGIAWIAGAAALHLPGERDLRREVQRSEILSRLNDVLPPSGPILNALARLDPLPEISGPSADVPAPRAAIVRDPQVQAAGRSVVRILGTACGLGVAGSGWVAGPGLVVTNAHVVAGQDDTTVQVAGEGPRLDADAVAFDPTNDVAVLRVGGISAPALPIAGDPEPGTGAAIMGFPENGPFDVRPGRIGEERTVNSQDAYGRGPVRRTITPLRGLVRSGNSGGPMVDGAGRVVTTIFAATVGGGRRGGFGVPNGIVERRLAQARTGGTVSTGPCAAG
jgi:S1-C subfamily serine protease